MSKFAKANTSLRSTIYNKKTAEETLSSILGERFREYRNKWEKGMKFKVTQDYPLHLNFELFYGCNLKCIMCINALPPDKRGFDVAADKSISFDKYREIINEGVRHNLYAVALNGYNEPLMQEDLTDYIRYAREAGVIDVFTITNATLLTPKRSEDLIKSGLTQIKFSMDSIRKETYEKVRLGANFDRTMKNINTFLEIKKKSKSVLPVTRISIVKLKENIDEVNEFVEYWSDKIDYITVQEMQTPFVDTEEYNKFETASRVKGPLFKKCFEPFLRLYIRNNGDVLPCCSWYGRNLVVGNIYEQSIHSIWNGSVMAGIRQAVNSCDGKHPGPCVKCRKAAENGGGL